MINVTEPFLPPKEEYFSLLEGIWDNKLLTNMGPLSKKLENDLKNYLKISSISFVSNGTIALQIAIKLLSLKGEIITTPFTYVATSSSIVWEGCKPVFVDINKKNFNIDVNQIEKAITKKTSAILATHVYGNPCDVFEIEKIANKYNLKVIYDASHAFGVNVNKKSIFNFGDVSTCSTHATKIFHTIEGGFIVCKNNYDNEVIGFMRNFGHNGPESYKCLGINAKNSEFHSAMGLINLKYFDKILEKRKSICLRYDENLKNFSFVKPEWSSKSNKNYSYYPILFENEKLLLKCVSILEKKNIFCRRYFFPSLSKVLPYIKHQDFKISDDVSTRVLCLPLYYSLKLEQVDYICKIIKECFD